MSVFERLSSLRRRLAGDERGVVLIFMALALIPLLAFTGLAVDGVRAYLVEARLTRALDAAGLAGAHDFDDPAARDDAIRRYFAANFPAGYLGAQLSGPTWTANADTRQLTITASAALDTTLMAAVGQPRISAAGRSVIKADGGLELVLVMDNTGSMGDRPSSGDKTAKIVSMKNGAETLIDTIYGNRDTIPRMWVGLVPFVTTVNIGKGRAGWLKGYDPNAYKDSPLGWKGCVEARVPRVNAPYNEPAPAKDKDGVTMTRDITDDPPAIEQWRPYLYPTTTGNINDGDADNTNNKNDGSSRTRDYYTENNWTPVYEWQDDDGRKNDYQGPNRSCPSPLTTLVSSKSTVVSAIKAMGAFTGTGTMNHVGLVWGWRLLSPRWRGAWDGEMAREQLPQDYGKTGNKKVVVILTDGDNRLNTYGNNDTDYTSYGRMAWGWSGTTNLSTADQLLDTRLTHVCASMKAVGILIYTITFDVKNGSPIWSLFENCATRPSMHFDSKDSASLTDAFTTIGHQINKLRVAE